MVPMHSAAKGSTMASVPIAISVLPIPSTTILLLSAVLALEQNIGMEVRHFCVFGNN